MTTPAPVDLDAVEARANAATPGPWEHVDYSDPPGQPMTNYGAPSTFMGCGSVITLGEGVAGGDIAAPNGDLYPRSGYSPSDDMAFIAAARTDVPALVAEVRALRAQVADAEERWKQWAIDALRDSERYRAWFAAELAASTGGTFLDVLPRQRRQLADYLESLRGTDGSTDGTERPEWSCMRCGSTRWVRASLNGGYTVIRQCIPCGHYSRTLADSIETKERT